MLGFILGSVLQSLFSTKWISIIILFLCLTLLKYNHKLLEDWIILSIRIMTAFFSLVGVKSAKPLAGNRKRAGIFSVVVVKAQSLVDDVVLKFW